MRKKNHQCPNGMPSFAFNCLKIDIKLLLIITITLKITLDIILRLSPATISLP